MEASDTSLVSESLAGNHEAFGQIVARYQTLICSLTYSGIGNLSQSEDLAQETFIAAWRQLAKLREPQKLRSWLCGIARNLTYDALKKQGREPTHAAELLEAVHESPDAELQPHDLAISKEEEVILWRSVGHIPEIYREPLVLFYREHQSIEAVAQNLELSEDAVKQRLSRGRKMLHAQVLAFVEGALEKTSPGKAFSLGVIAVLPTIPASAKAATVGAALATGAPVAKVLTGGSLGALLAILGSAYVSLRAQSDDSKSPRERQFLLQMFGLRMILILISFVLFFVAVKFPFFRAPIHFDYLAAAFFFYFCFDVVFLSACQSHRRQQIQIEDNTYEETEWRIPRKFSGSKSDSLHSKMKDSLKLMRLAAFSIISGTMVGLMVGAMSVRVGTQQTWQQQKQYLGHTVLVVACVAAAGVALVQVLDFAIRQNLPRFLQIQRSRRFFVAPIIMGLSTLWFFDFRQYVAHTAGNAFNRASPTEILIFNLVVASAYTVFIIGIHGWKRKRVGRPGCATSSVYPI